MNPLPLARLLCLGALLAACSNSSILGGTRPDGGATGDITAVDTSGADITIADTSADRPATPASATAMIGPAGGTVTLTIEPGGDRVTLTFPPGAVSTSMPITITQSSSPVPAGYTAVSPLYEFSPTGLVLATPARVSIQPGRPVDLAQMDILWAPTVSSGFRNVGGSGTAGVIAADIRHFSVGFVGRWSGDAGGAPECEEGYVVCGPDCVDVSFDEDDCGACGERCMPMDVCFEGRCIPTVCNADVGDCDGNLANGCEARLLADSMNCGACGISCDGGTCVGGVCV